MEPNEQNVRGKIVILSFYVFLRIMMNSCKEKGKGESKYHIYLRNSNPT